MGNRQVKRQLQHSAPRIFTGKGPDAMGTPQQGASSGCVACECLLKAVKFKLRPEGEQSKTWLKGKRE